MISKQITLNKTAKYLQPLLSTKIIGNTDRELTKNYSDFKKDFGLTGMYIHVESDLFTSLDSCIYLIGHKHVNCAKYFKDTVLIYEGPSIGLPDNVYLIEVNFKGEYDEIFTNFLNSKYTKMYTKKFLIDCPWEFFVENNDMGVLAPVELKDNDKPFYTSFRMRRFDYINKEFNGIIYNDDMELESLLDINEETYGISEAVVSIAEFSEGDTKISRCIS